VLVLFPLHRKGGFSNQISGMGDNNESSFLLVNKYSDLHCLEGILKKDWIHKHQNLLPAVLVLFVDLNWNEAALEEKTRACAQVLFFRFDFCK
jgi:hypothetical protein